MNNIYIIGGAIVVALIAVALVFFRKQSVKIAKEFIEKELPVLEKDFPFIIEKVYGNLPKSAKLFLSKGFIKNLVEDASKGVVSGAISDVASSAISAIDSVVYSGNANVVEPIQPSASDSVSGNIQP